MTFALSVRGLKKTYDDGFQALKQVDLNVGQGDFFALLGPNGAGKSTTIGIISSLVRKTSGQIEVFGHDIDTHSQLAKRDIGVVPQEFNFAQFETVEHIVVNQAGYYGIPRAKAKQQAEKYLKQLGLWDKRHTKALMLSGGMKRRLMIARALVHEPRLLILDEPTAGVDIELRRSMWEFLKQINADGTTIILTTHYLEEAEMLCRNVAIIDSGEIVENTTVKALLKTLNKEVFILDTLESIPDSLQIDRYEVKRIEDHTLEVEVDKGHSLNQLFQAMSDAGVQVVSMRNKSNRLEELFLSRVKRHDESQKSGGAA